VKNAVKNAVTDAVTDAVTNAVEAAIAAIAMLTMCIRNESGACAGQRKMTSSHGDGARRENRSGKGSEPCERGVEAALYGGRKASATHAPTAPETVRI
jgi:hypothetical protein